MAQIEIGVRGDPYWLGNPAPFGAAGDTRAAIDERFADYMKGVPMFRLLAHFPHSGEDAHGRRRPRVDYSLTGVFIVIRVTSRFEGGLFEQTLSAMRDYAINPVDSNHGDDLADRRQASLDEWGKERKERRAAAEAEAARVRARRQRAEPSAEERDNHFPDAFSDWAGQRWHGGGNDGLLPGQYRDSNGQIRWIGG